MELTFQYEPTFLKESIEALKEKFPSLEERAGSSPKKDEEIDLFLEEIRNNLASGSDTHPSFTKDREVELAIHAYGRQQVYSNGLIDNSLPDDGLLDVLDQIITQRFRRKLFYLGWMLLQQDFSNKGRLYAMKTLCRLMKARYPEEYETTLPGKFCDIWEEGVPELAALLLQADCGTLKYFCRKYSVSLESGFGISLQTAYFSICSRYEFKTNREQLLNYFNTTLPLIEYIHDESDLRYPELKSLVHVFCNYLDKLEVIEFFDEVNFAVIEHCGHPAWGGIFWYCMIENIEDAAIKIYSWLEYKRIQKHFRNHVKGFDIWSEYFKYIKDICYDEINDFLAMDFGSFVAVDRKEEGRSYLYSKKHFNLEYEDYKERRDAWDDDMDRSWHIIPEHVVTARELVIDDNRGQIYSVGYDRVHILYLREILKNMLDPGTRKKYIT